MDQQAAWQRTLDEYFASLKAMDVKRYVSVFAADGECEDPAGSPVHKGQPAIEANMAGIFSLFQSVELTPQHTFFSPVSAIVRWAGNCVARNGKQGTFEGVDVFRFDSAGQISRVEGHWDAGALLSRIA